MIIKGAAIKSFLQKPDPSLRAILLYGPDNGLIKENAEQLAKTQVADLNDPFSVVEIFAPELKSDPARLGDEAGALSFGGGGRVVRVRQATDASTNAIASFLDGDTPSGAIVIIEAGELAARSSLRKLFEGSENAVAVACYADDARSLPDIIRQTMAPHNQTVSRDAMALLVQSLGADRSLTRNELEKLAIYKGGPGEISIDDVRASLSDAAATSMDDVVFSAASGNFAKLDSALEKTFDEGISPIAVVRASTRHFQRLHLARGEMDNGKSVEDAVRSLRPPVFYKYMDQFKSQLRIWPSVRLARAFELLTQAELDCKTTALPAPAMCHRALIQIAQAARSVRR